MQSGLSEQQEPWIPALSVGAHLKGAGVGVDLGLLSPGLIQDTLYPGLRTQETLGDSQSLSLRLRDTFDTFTWTSGASF